MKLTKRCVSILFIIFFLSACDVGSSKSEEKTALLVHPTGRDVQYNKVKGTSQVSYSVSVKYPARDVIDWLSNELKQNGWKPLDYDFLDPKIKLSHVTGWTSFIDSRTPVEYQIHQWLGNWQDASGGVVRYQLRYEYPKRSQPELSVLKVSAVYISPELAREAEKFPK
jgi:hypothetical protein